MTTKRALGAALISIALLVAGCGSPTGPADRPAAAAPTAPPEPAPTRQAEPVAAPAESPVAAPPEQASSDTAPLEVAPAQPGESPSAAIAATPAPPPPVAAPPAPAPVATPAPPSPPSPPIAKAPEPPPAPAPAAPSSVPVAASTPVPARVPEPAAAATPTPDVVDKGGAMAVAATKPGLSRVGNDNCETCHEVQFASWSEGGHAARKPPLDCESCHGLGSEYSKNSVMKDPVKARAAGMVIPERSFCSKCHTRGVTDEFLEKVHAHED